MLLHIPNLITCFRFFVSIFLVLDALDGRPSNFFVLLFFFAAISDALDGYLARKLKMTTQAGSILDGYADAALYASAFLCAYLFYPEIIKGNLLWIGLVLLSQIISWGICLVKFGRLSSYHTFSAKFWGITIVTSLMYLFLFKDGRLLPLMAIVGIISNTEESLITIVMPYWKCGVVHVKKAMLLRKNMKTRDDFYRNVLKKREE